MVSTRLTASSKERSVPARIDLRVSLERRCSAVTTSCKERSALSRFRSSCCTDSRRVKPIALASAGEKKESIMFGVLSKSRCAAGRVSCRSSSLAASTSAWSTTGCDSLAPMAAEFLLRAGCKSALERCEFRRAELAARGACAGGQQLRALSAPGSRATRRPLIARWTT